MLIPLHALLATGRADEQPVCHDGRRFVPWREFAGRVAAHAAYFSTRGEARWLLADDDPPSFAIKLLALLHAGKQVVIPPNSQPESIARLADAFDAVAGDEVASDAHASFRFDPRAAIVDLYTSGSTGEPKCVRRTLAQFQTEIDALEALWGRALGAARIVATAPHQHIYGLLFRVLWPLSAGRPFDSVTCADPGALAARLAVLGETALVSSPAQLSRLPELVPLATLQPLPRIVFSSGGPLPAATAAEFHRQLGYAPTEVFGSTETGGIAWRRQDSGDDAWTPLPGIGVSAEADGALSLRSPFLASRAALRMDDAVELLPDGRFRLRGRLDRVVKIEEKRLSLPELETRLGEHPWVAGAAAVVLGGRRQRIGALLVLNERGRAELSGSGRRDVALALRRHLAGYYESVLLPRHWRFVDELPFNERGKLTQAALAALFAQDRNEPSPA